MHPEESVRDTYSSTTIFHEDGSTTVAGKQGIAPHYISNGDGTFDLYYFPTYNLSLGTRLGNYRWGYTDDGDLCWLYEPKETK